MGHGLSNILAVMSAESAASSSLWLALVITLILVLSHLLATSGQQERIVFSFQAISPGRRFTLTALPALIGLLPMPGGALFSAPMVQTALGSDEVKPELKVAINYWFRHLWEFWWPLYPGVILAMAVARVEEWRFMVHGALLSPFAILGGWFFILRRLRTRPGPVRSAARVPLTGLALELSPIAIVILGVLMAKIAFALFGSEPGKGASGGLETAALQQGPIFLGLALAIWSTCRRNRLSARRAWRLAGHPMLVPLLLLVLAIMAFRGMLEASHAMEGILADLTRHRIPPVVMVMALPFLGGMITGIAVGFVGTALPLVTTLIAGMLARGGGATDPVSALPYVTLAFAFGFAGMILSPLHACLVLTRRYFNASPAGMYRYLLGPTLGVVAAALGLWWLTR
jgi:hypothetical protein